MHCGHSDIARRITRDDCRIRQSDFYPPQDTRTPRPDIKMTMERYRHYRDFNRLCEYVGLFD